MASESESNLRLEIGHVLFIDLVGYSKLLIDEQKERLRQLTDIVLATSQVKRQTRNSFDYLRVMEWRWCFGTVWKNRRNARWRSHEP
jgi:hypothetical protein